MMMIGDKNFCESADRQSRQEITRFFKEKNVALLSCTEIYPNNSCKLYFATQADVDDCLSKVGESKFEIFSGTGILVSASFANSSIASSRFTSPAQSVATTPRQSAIQTPLTPDTGTNTPEEKSFFLKLTWPAKGFDATAAGLEGLLESFAKYLRENVFDLNVDYLPVSVRHMNEYRYSKYYFATQQAVDFLAPIIGVECKDWLSGRKFLVTSSKSLAPSPLAADDSCIVVLVGLAVVGVLGEAALKLELEFTYKVIPLQILIEARNVHFSVRTPAHATLAVRAIHGQQVLGQVVTAFIRSSQFNIMGQRDSDIPRSLGGRQFGSSEEVKTKFVNFQRFQAEAQYVHNMEIQKCETQMIELPAIFRHSIRSSTSTRGFWLSGVLLTSAIIVSAVASEAEKSLPFGDFYKVDGLGKSFHSFVNYIM